MLFSYNWLKDYIKGDLLKPERLAEILTKSSFEVESVEKKGKDYILDIDVLPNRGHDCLSHWGLAREISALLDKKLDPLKIKKLKQEKASINPINLKIKIPSLVSRYSAIVIEGIETKQSPEWLKQRIESVGFRPINNIVDLTNYLMLETGQPFHAFDYDKIKNQNMILRGSRQGEKLTTLDGANHNLNQGVMVIENDGKLIDLIGIMGGKISEVDSATKNIVLQAGNFDRQAIYRAVNDLKHKTEASSIYAQGIDPNLTISALERANFLLTKIGGGRTIQIIDIYPKKVLPKKIKLDLAYVDRLLGVKIKEKEIKNILNRLQFKVTKVGPSSASMLPSIEVEVPTWRLDISIQEDLIEEIGRIYGYDRISVSFPIASLVPPKRNIDIFWEDFAKNILKEAGFNEVYNYSFNGEEKNDILMGYWDKKEIIELENPISKDFKYLRPSLIPNLLKNVASNLRYFQDFKIFELGKVFGIKTNEKRMLSGLIVSRDKSDELFYELKGVVDSLLNKLGISEIYYDEYRISPNSARILVWDLKRCAEIKIGSDKIGLLGEISEKIRQKLKIKEKIFLFDIDFEKLQEFCREEHEYQPISQHPSAVRDIAVLVPRDIKVVDVLNKINAVGGKLIRDIDLFDIYEGEELPEGRKNLAFHIIYQAEDRTLAPGEIDKIQNKIIKELEKDPEWEVRR